MIEKGTSRHTALDVESVDSTGKTKPGRNNKIWILLIGFVAVLMVLSFLGSTHETVSTPIMDVAGPANTPTRRGSKTPIRTSTRMTPEELEEQGRLEMQKKLTQHSSEDDGPPIGYVRVPKIPEGRRTDDDKKLHIIFSSGCNWFQHWQSELVLATANFVKQRGRITRIVSGCHDRSAEKISHRHQTFPSGLNDLLVPFERLNRSTNENFGLFITPSFPGAKDFPWINKPSSIRYFVEKARPELDRMGESIIVILDPDFVFLKPLTMSPLPRSDILFSGSPSPVVADIEDANVVIKGRPVAQHYGLEGGWVTRFPVAKITGEGSPATTYSSGEAAKWFSVGPPLMLHVDDLTDLAALWQDYMKPVLEVRLRNVRESSNTYNDSWITG